MGAKPGYRQMTIYLPPELYDQVKFAAYTLDEDLYVFASEALTEAINRRMTKAQRAAIEHMAKQFAGKNGTSREKRR